MPSFDRRSRPVPPRPKGSGQGGSPVLQRSWTAVAPVPIRRGVDIGYSGSIQGHRPGGGSADRRGVAAGRASCRVRRLVAPPFRWPARWPGAGAAGGGRKATGAGGRRRRPLLCPGQQATVDGRDGRPMSGPRQRTSADETIPSGSARIQLASCSFGGRLLSGSQRRRTGAGGTGVRPPCGAAAAGQARPARPRPPDARRAGGGPGR